MKYDGAESSSLESGGVESSSMKSGGSVEKWKGNIVVWRCGKHSIESMVWNAWCGKRGGDASGGASAGVERGTGKRSTGKQNVGYNPFNREIP